jgi:thiol:disulfide interchange protein DsbC
MFSGEILVRKTLLGLAVFIGVHGYTFGSDNSLIDIPYFNWQALRLADAVKEVRGDGSRKIAVFTEPECGYCRKYEKTLEKVDNVTIYRFLMPLDTKSMARSIELWCSGKTNTERLNHLLVAMHDRQARFTAENCVNPIADNMRFGKKYDIYLTPTTIGADGRLVQGYLPLANLERWLSGRGAFDK